MYTTCVVAQKANLFFFRMRQSKLENPSLRDVI